MHWLAIQLTQTWVEIKNTITIPHIVAGSLGYALIHGIIKLNSQASKSLIIHLETTHDKYRWLHTKNAHKGRYGKCIECQTRQIRQLPEWPLEPQQR